VAAPEGRALITADYSQIELRIAAALTRDETLCAAYREGADVHTLTARRISGRETVTREDRQLAKAVNFGLLYGMGAERLQSYASLGYGVTLSPDEARRARARFFSTYRGIQAWHRRTADSTVPETRTVAGRRHRVRPDDFLLRLNLPVQGTGADGLKAALGLLWQRRDQAPGAFPVLAVHDELVIECDTGAVEEASAWLRSAMVDGMQQFIPDVPVEVELGAGETWGKG
jgi:DNA polymerase-1